MNNQADSEVTRSGALLMPISVTEQILTAKTNSKHIT